MKWPLKTNDTRREERLRQQMAALLPRLRRFAGNLAGDADRGDDLVQVACERALGRLDQFRDGSRLDSWLYRIIHTQWIDRLRRRQTRETHIRNHQPAPGENGETGRPAGHIEALLDVRKALHALSEEQRAAISLVVVEGYTYAEAAVILETPAGTVASRVARARREMVRHIRHERPGKIFKVHAGGGKDTGS